MLVNVWVPAIASGEITGPFNNLKVNTLGANNGDVLKYNSATGNTSWAADNGVTLPYLGTSTGNTNAFQITQANINGTAPTTAIKGENLDAQGQAAYFVNSSANAVNPALTATSESQFIPVLLSKLKEMCFSQIYLLNHANLIMLVKFMILTQVLPEDVVFLSKAIHQEHLLPVSLMVFIITTGAL